MSAHAMQKALAGHRLYVRIALILSVFAWIAVYQWLALWSGDMVDALTHTLLLYALSQVTTLVVLPYAGTLLRKGIRRTMVIGVLCAAFAYALLAILEVVGPGEYMNIWVVFAMLIGAHRALYHVPYALERAALGRPHTIMNLGLCFVPIVCGYGMAFEPASTAAAASAILVASLIPLRNIKETYERYSWGYRETFSKLLEPRFAKFIDSSLTRGIEASALYLLWPIAVFFILGSSYVWLGFVLAFTMLFAYLMRTHLPRSFAAFSPTVQSVALGSTWLVRMAVASPGGILFANWYAIIVAPRRTVSHDEPLDGGTFVDEFSALKEMSAAAGRLVLALLTALFVVKLGVPTAIVGAFLVAALAALYGSIVMRQE